MRTVLFLLFSLLLSINGFSQKTCLELNDLTKTGFFYSGEITVEGENVTGEIMVKNNAGEIYTVTFAGSSSIGGRLSVEVAYSNDIGDPYSEKWILNNVGLVLESLKVTIPRKKCE